MSRLIDINLFLKLEKEEHGRDLAYFEKQWNVTRGLISRWRYGGKRIGRDLSRQVFATVQKRFPAWTAERYEKEWPEIHARFLVRKRKLDLWEATASEQEAAPCGNCGDAGSRHEDGRRCHDCQLECREYEPYIRRGRRSPMTQKLTA